MDKRTLAKIPVENVAPEIREFAHNADIDIFVSLKESGEDNTLIMNIYQAEDIIKGVLLPQRRIFIAEHDYITQNMTGTGSRWLTGRIDSILGVDYWYSRKRCAFTDSISRRIYEDRYGVIDDMAHWYKKLYDWQSDIVAERLTARHERELAHTNEMMAHVPSTPKGFLSWINDTALAEYHYLVYQSGNRRHTRGYCTCCRNKVSLDTKAQRIRRNEHGHCPECGKEIIFMPAGAQLNVYREKYRFENENHKWVCLFQKVKGGIVARFFEAGVRFPGREANIHRVPHYWHRELCRTFYMDGKEMESFEYRDYKQSGILRWCPDADKVCCGLAITYTRNLKRVLKGTEYQYCALNLFQNTCKGEAIPVWRYMAKYPVNKYFEFMVKTGLTDMLKQKLGDNSYIIRDVLNDNGTTPQEVFNVPKPYVRLIIDMKPSLTELRLIQQCGMDGVMPKAEEISRWHELFGCDDETLGMVNAHNAHFSLSRFMNYIEKQSGRSAGYRYPKAEPRDVKSDWKDYIRWAAELGYDLTDTYYLLPSDLHKAHDHAHAEYEKQRSKLKAARNRRIARQVKKICASAVKGKGYEMRTDDLMIVVPKDAEDIRREGNIQHHCVGGYVERVAQGKTMILFVRKVSAPDIPYYTMEWADNHVVQCRGIRNSSMTDEVKAFVGAFEKLMVGMAPTEPVAV